MTKVAVSELEHEDERFWNYSRYKLTQRINFFSAARKIRIAAEESEKNKKIIV